MRAEYGALAVASMALWPGPALKVLLAEDNAINQQFGVALLKKMGHQVSLAENGKDALAALKLTAVDLVLMDIQMPEMDGFQVCRLLRSEGTSADIPVIFVTAVDSLEGETEGLELNAVDYITKPINLKLAKLRIRNQLELRRQRDIVEEQNTQLGKAAESAPMADARALMLRVRALTYSSDTARPPRTTRW